MKLNRQKLLNAAPLLVLVAALLFFAMQTPKFLETRNLLNILSQASATGILAIGMTFVLLTAGVDLSVGAVMFVAAAAAGKMSQANFPMPLILAAMLGIGALFAAFNTVFIIRLRVAAFIVTLATLFIGRGLGLCITQTRAINLPESFLSFGAAHFLGVAAPAWIFLITLVVSHLTLTRTPFGRHLFALGHSLDGAKKAGLPTVKILSGAYFICSLCAVIAALIALGQLGAVSPKFGEQKEFAAIAAAVLGGTSLYGGRGNIFPGTLVGSLLIQTVENGLVLINANPYLYPMITSAIIFAAILLESLRKRIEK